LIGDNLNPRWIIKYSSTRATAGPRVPSIITRCPPTAYAHTQTHLGDSGESRQQTMGGASACVCSTNHFKN
jgi:hypothetical protein